MKKQILNIGKALSRAEQKVVFGGLALNSACRESGDACAVKGATSNTSCCAGTCVSEHGILGVCS